MRLILYVLAILLASQAVAQEGQGVGEGGPLIKKDGQQITHGSNEAASYPPLRVTIIDTNDQAARADSSEQKAEKHDAEDLEAQRKAANAAEGSANIAEWAMLATWFQVGLAFAGTLLLVGTLYLMIQANRVLADDYKSANPPKIGVYQVVCPVEPGKPLSGSLMMINNGGTDAGIFDDDRRQGYLTFHVAKEPPVTFPESGVKLNTGRMHLDSGRLPTGAPAKWEFEADFSVAETTFRAMKSGSKSLFILGIIRFQDSRRSPGFHRTLFCRRYCPETGRWIHTNDPDYEYQT